MQIYACLPVNQLVELVPGIAYIWYILGKYSKNGGITAKTATFTNVLKK